MTRPFDLQNRPLSPSNALYGALTRAAVAIGRLDQRLHNHPLLPAILFRERLEAARICARVDGYVIDQWYLAAELEGLRPVIPGEDAIDRGSFIDNAKIAFEQYRWLVQPTRIQTTQIRQTTELLRSESAAVGPLLGAARAFHRWIDDANSRSPMRGALVAFWQETGLLRVGLPLTGTRAFASGTSWERSAWLPCFLDALADEAEGIHARVLGLERQWHHARAHSGARRRNSRAGTAIDLLAAFPLLSATRLADLLDISLKAAYLLLERFLAEGLVTEVTHRTARRLFALKGFEPLRDAVLPPVRPLPGRKRGRPRCDDSAFSMDIVEVVETAEPAPVPFEPLAIDYTALEEAIALIDAAIARSQVFLNEES
ncbi:MULTISPECIES: hypothetical protein [Asaia]|uniref:hypothetical protein n=1 Tax=Asaia TaxID=91914 RepID=UPI002555E26D|nr:MULTISPECIES: hypothetical protein [Asaia]MDL2172530.1 hypothetical protein [Asaia sp. HumB]MDR6184041.1 hypothetical protein [Asaia bogorensis NBRC 16594]